MTGHSTDRVLANGFVVLQQLVERDPHLVVLLDGNTADSRGITIVSVGKLTLFGATILEVGVHDKFEVLVELHLQLTTCHHKVLHDVIAVVTKRTGWVATNYTSFYNKRNERGNYPDFFNENYLKKQ